MSGLLNLGGSEQQTDISNVIDTETVTSTGGDIVTTDSSAQITSISAQDVTFVSADPSIGILQTAVDTIAGFGQQATAAGAQAQTQALKFASGFDPGARDKAKKPIISLNTGLIIGGSLIALFIGIRFLRG